jgi:hypothetical protein
LLAIFFAQPQTILILFIRCSSVCACTSNPLSLQAIYDLFYAEGSISNYASYITQDTFHAILPLAQQELVPSSLVITATIQKHWSAILLKALFDPGSDNMFIHEWCLPPVASPLVSNKASGSTLAGTFLLSTLLQWLISCYLNSMDLTRLIHNWFGFSLPIVLRPLHWSVWPLISLKWCFLGHNET